MNLETTSGAVFSPCRTWRYVLWRVWGSGSRMVAFIGLNPSTADESKDDPTIRRCIGFAKAWGYDGLFMLNLFGFRATQPAAMMAARDPVGPDNDHHLREVTKKVDLVVAAWGSHGIYQGRDWLVRRKVLAGVPLKCFGSTLGGLPLHPLYLPKTAQLEAL